MPQLLASAAGDNGIRIGLVAATFGFGLRHGIDWDHIAAIADISGSQTSRRRSLLYTTLYALGHGLVVFVLGVVAIVWARELPDSVDAAMERVVGLTLVLLGVYVFYALVRHGRDFRLRSRWMVAFAALRALVRRFSRRPAPPAETVVVTHTHEHPVDEEHADEAAHDHVAVGGAPHHHAGGPGLLHSHRHQHVAVAPEDPFGSYSRATAAGVGMIHGVGAETPTQVLLFITAAGVGGKGAGVVLLLCFLAGLVTSNTAIALASAFGFLHAASNFTIYAAVSIVAAAFSLVLGLVFLLGAGSVLPSMFSG